jgi:multiple sugar transport system permease protein
MLPPQVTLIPTFLLYRQLGWIDTYAPLLVPCFLGNAFFIFLLRQFFSGFPKAIIESARIDGALEPVILARIVVPLCKPPLLTVMMFSGIGAWNDFVGPLIYLSSESRKTLALGLQSFMGQFSSEWGMLMAASLLMAAPVIVLFLVAQRQFVEGIAMTGMKG